MKPYRHPLPVIHPPVKASTYEITMRFVMVAFLILFWIAFYLLMRKALG
jgi:hypothetical protein